MTDVTFLAASNHRHAYARDQWALRMAMIATYPFFFAAAVLRWLNPFAARPSRVSLLAQTRERAAASIPFIFMG